MQTPLEIFIFIDALGWEVSETHSFASDILPYRQSVEMQFGYSSAALPTILTGQPPEVHGHWNYFYYNPATSPFRFFRFLRYFLLPPSFWRRGRVRNLMSKLLARHLGYTGYFQLYQMPLSRLPYFDYSEKQDIFAPNGMSPLPNLHDVLLDSGLKFQFANWHLPESDNLAAAKLAAADSETRFVFLYLARLDSMLHQFSLNDPVIKQHLAAYEQECRALLTLARQHHDFVRMTVISDHGMTPLKTTFDLQKIIDSLQLDFGRQYCAFYDATMARFWFFDENAKTKIMQAAQQAPGHWLTKQEKINYQINFPDQRHGEEIFLLSEGVQISPSDMGLKPMPGMHGYAPHHPGSKAALLSNEPVPDGMVKQVANFFDLMKQRIQEMKNKTASNIK